MKLSLYALLSMLLTAQIGFAQKRVADADLLQLGQMMTGSFSTAPKSKRDNTFLETRLYMKPMWTFRTGEGIWLYIEQSLSAEQDKPYLQRVYHVKTHDDTTIILTAYTFRRPLQFVGEWKKEEPLEHLTPDSLVLESGCAIYLSKISDALFVGSTRGKKCGSSLRGVAYTISEITITPKMFKSWDRGFDEKNHQVWGAVTGGYEFIKMGQY